MPSSSARPPCLLETPQSFLSASSGSASFREPRGSWASRQAEAMASAWSRGERISAQELLARHSEIDDEAAIRLIYEEVCLRRESGQDVATTEVLNRFPRWKDELEVLLGCDRMLRPFLPGVLFPRRRRRPRARSGCWRSSAAAPPARPILAAEPALRRPAGRVQGHLRRPGRTPLAGAAAAHAYHPAIFRAEFAQRGLRALCMPYLGGTSLARILEGSPTSRPRDRRAAICSRFSTGRKRHWRQSAIADGPYRRYLEQASYVQAVCWVAACLAEALSCVHAHGLIHMDVKPSNVLIAGDGLPVLLDFHLAHRPIAAGERIADRLGGTPGWMAPEHCLAFKAVGAGKRSRYRSTTGPISTRWASCCGMPW